jgi:hypothetical protein
LNDGAEVFQDWKPFLDKHFPNMDPGFTSYYIFEFKNGVVKYKELDDEGTSKSESHLKCCGNFES